MTQCNPKPIQYPSCKRRKVEVDFQGGSVTSDGGSLHIQQADQMLGLLHEVAKHLPDPRRSTSITHDIESLLRQRVFSLCLGYEDLNDHTDLRLDPAIQTTLSKDTLLASAPTLCRFENYADRKVAGAVHEVFIEKFIQSFDTPPEKLILDFDATDDEVLTKAGIDRAQSLATVLPTDADNVYVVLSARLLSSSLQIVARAGEASAIQKLQRAGATRVISPFSSGAMKMARFMLNPSIEDFLEITDESGSDLELAEIQIQTDSQYIGKPLAKTDLREQGIMVIGIRRTSGKHIIAPEGTAIIEPGDSLFAFGNANSVNALAEKCV